MQFNFITRPNSRLSSLDNRLGYQWPQPSPSPPSSLHSHYQKGGKKIAADRCLSSAKRSTFKLSLVFFSWYVGCNSCSFRPITKTRSYPARINIQGYRCGLLQQSTTGKSPALSAPSCLACAGEVAHLCCSGSDCVRQPECVYCPFYSSFRLTHTQNLLPLLPLLCSPSFHLSLNWNRRRTGLGGGSLGPQRALCLGAFHMVSFKLAYWTHYAIIYFHIQPRDVERPVGPTLFSYTPPSPLTPHPPPLLSPPRPLASWQRNPNKGWDKKCRSRFLFHPRSSALIE